MPGQFIAPAPRSEFIELTRSKSGRLFRKHILTKGTLIHPVTGSKISIDDDFLTALTANFDAHVCDIVQVPVVDGKNHHTEDPDRNMGEVIRLERDGDKLFAVIDARDSERADKLGKTLLGASAMLHQNYTSSATGKKVGPTLLHVAVTNRPYITDLDDFQEILAASADTQSETPLMLSAADTEGTTMTYQELLTVLKDVHGVDVEALQAKAADGDAAVGTLAKLSGALDESGLIELSAGEIATGDQVIGAIVALANSNVELERQVGEFNAKAAEDEVDKLIGEGRILPVQRDAYVKLAREDHDTFTSLVPEKPLIELSAESGFNTPGSEHELDVDAEIKRLHEQFQG